MVGLAGSSNECRICTFGRSTMKIFMKTRGYTSVDQLTTELDGLAETYGLRDHFYEASAARAMPEFDALRWVTLCTQRSALRHRDHEAMCRDWDFPPVPSRFLEIYELRGTSKPLALEDAEESMKELAA